MLATIFDTFWQNTLDTSWLEFIAVIFGLLSVWYAKQEKIWVYPTGIISVLIYVYICFGIKLYADAGINLFYFIMSVYGWYMWTKKSEKPALRITKSSLQNWVVSVVMFVLSGLLIILLLKHFKADDLEYWSTSIPYIDTFTTAIFIVGMWLMALKKLENWIFWIIGDLISVPLYAFKGLVFTSFQFLVFLIIAIMGYYAWKKKIEADEA
ncbi:MAG: nicotinamide riboside transporter PnuC [Bacteroidales bacterium]|nr:nicotinamide riboside transporter PnuC [Bacteroidales bacterium]MCF8402760.1 nicotinamide riboside transporter PnuC [Bacteroidales bacterium]